MKILIIVPVYNERGKIKFKDAMKGLLTILRVKFFEQREISSKLIKIFAFGIALLYLSFVIIRLKNFGYIPSYFVCAGSYFCDPKIVPKNLVVPTEFGYDGQFYYRLSLNPFTNKRTQYGITIDAPPYRHQRILYPLIVWFLSCGGNYLLVPWIMIVVHLIAIFLIIFLSITYSKTENQISLEWLILSLLPGFLLSLSRNTYEVLASVFILGAFLSYKKDNPILFTIFCILAVFTKETTVVISILGVVVYLFYKKRFYPMLLLPVVLFAFWQLFLYFNWGSITFVHGKGNFGIPFSGIKNYILYISHLNRDNIKIGAITIILFIFSFVITTLVSLKNSKNVLTKISFLIYLFLVISATDKIWTEANILRVFPELYISGWITIVEAKNRFRWFQYMLNLLLWLMIASWKINGL